jgi:hypothetical protein
MDTQHQHQVTDLLGQLIPLSQRSPTERTEYVRDIQRQIQRTLAQADLRVALERLVVGSFVQIAGKDRTELVGREIVATAIVVDEPEWSTVTLANWVDGERQDLVVEIGAISHVVKASPLAARYAFDRVDTAEGSLRPHR